MAVDIVGGAHVHNTRASARWYERAGQGATQHMQFAALHVHPAALACVDRGVERQEHAVRFTLAHYCYLMASTAVLRSFRGRRRLLGVALTAGGLVLDRAIGPSETAPWFAWFYYPKLLMGHAGASLWPGADLHGGGCGQRCSSGPRDRRSPLTRRDYCSVTGRLHGSSGAAAKPNLRRWSQ